MKKGERRTLIVPHWLGYGVVATRRKSALRDPGLDVELLDIR